MKISIIPKIKLFDTDLIDVKGNIVFGVNSFTIGNGSISESSNFSSQGNFILQISSLLELLELLYIQQNY